FVLESMPEKSGPFGPADLFLNQSNINITLLIPNVRSDWDWRPVQSTGYASSPVFPKAIIQPRYEFGKTGVSRAPSTVGPVPGRPSPPLKPASTGWVTFPAGLKI